MTDGYAGSPTVPRRRLGMQLKTAREASGLTVAEVARTLHKTARSVLRWEAGQTNMPIADLTALMDTYGIKDPTLRIQLESLHMLGRQSGWWAPYSNAIRPSFVTFLGLEAGASSLSEFSAMLIPGLLQTERYMRATMRAASPPLSEAAIDKRVAIRLTRQEAMFSRRVRTRFVIDESCLHRRVENVETMHDQLKHLLDVADTRHITIQVLPFSGGAHVSMHGSFSVLTFPAPDQPIACIELLNGELYADGPEARVYTDNFDRLREGALPEPLAMDHVDTIMRNVHHAL